MPFQNVYEAECNCSMLWPATVDGIIAEQPPAIITPWAWLKILCRGLIITAVWAGWAWDLQRAKLWLWGPKSTFKNLRLKYTEHVIMDVPFPSRPPHRHKNTNFRWTHYSAWNITQCALLVDSTHWRQFRNFLSKHHIYSQEPCSQNNPSILKAYWRRMLLRSVGKKTSGVYVWWNH